LPPMAEQVRIVEILEDLLSHLDAADNYLESCIDMLQRWMASWLAETCRNVEGDTCCFGDLILNAKAGLNRSRAQLVPQELGIPYLKMNNITKNGQLDLSDVAFVEADPTEMEIFSIRPGDLLLNTRNSAELIGKSTVADLRVDGWLYNLNIVRIRLVDRLLPEYCAIWLQSPDGIRQIKEQASATTNVSALYMNKVRNFQITVPPIQTQKQIISEYLSMITAENCIKTNITIVYSKNKTLRREVLAAAFSGRLTGVSGVAIDSTAGDGGGIERIEELANG